MRLLKTLERDMPSTAIPSGDQIVVGTVVRNRKIVRVTWMMQRQGRPYTFAFHDGMFKLLFIAVKGHKRRVRAVPKRKSGPKRSLRSR